MITPKPREGFLTLYALGANGLAGNYYPNSSALIQIGETVTWTIGTSNQMGSLQLVDVRVKLGNESIAQPNDTTTIPSPAPSVADFKQFISDNDTWEIPFVWRILNFTTAQNGHSRIIQVQIDDVTYSLRDSPTCSTLTSCRFRFIIELWTWNTDTGDFQIGWRSGNQQRISWLQLWFVLTPGAH